MPMVSMGIPRAFSFQRARAEELLEPFCPYGLGLAMPLRWGREMRLEPGEAARGLSQIPFLLRINPRKLLTPAPAREG
jgi:hypothetical protein